MLCLHVLCFVVTLENLLDGHFAMIPKDSSRSDTGDVGHYMHSGQASMFFPHKDLHVPVCLFVVSSRPSEREKPINEGECIGLCVGRFSNVDIRCFGLIEWLTSFLFATRKDRQRI